MKITIKEIRNIIREELSRTLEEAVTPEQKIELENLFIAAIGDYQDKLDREPSYKQYTQQIIDMLNDGLIEDATLIAAEYPEILAYILESTEGKKFNVGEESLSFMSLLYRKDSSGMNFIDYLAETPAADIIQGYKFRKRRMSKERKKAGKNKEMCASNQAEYEKFQMEWNESIESRQSRIEQLRQEMERNIYTGSYARDEPKYDYIRIRGVDGRQVKNKWGHKAKQLKDEISNLETLMQDYKNPNALKAARVLMNAGDRNCEWVKDIYVPESLRYAVILTKKEVYKPSRYWQSDIEAPEAARLIDKAFAYGSKNNIDVEAVLNSMDEGSQRFLKRYHAEKFNQ